MEESAFTIGFIGFGLIGGSIAKAIRIAHPDYRIIVTSRSLAPLRAAKDEGSVDIVTDALSPLFAECDFIFLCTPVSTISEYLSELKELIKPSCIITDVGSVKGTIHKTAIQYGLSANFVGGHPMAGSEQSGYRRSSAQLLQGAKYVITTGEDTPSAIVDTYRSLVVDMGAVPVIMDWETHDKTVAGISHLPHLVAAALAKTVQTSDDSARHMSQLAAGGFKDTTRVAASSPEMWSQICATNSDAICDMLDSYIIKLTEIRNHISSENVSTGCTSNDYIKELFSETREYRQSF